MDLPEFKKITASHFAAYKEALITLYIEAFSTGINQQYHRADETEAYLQSICNAGYGMLALVEQKLAAAILFTPLNFDKLVPKEISDNFDITQSLYLAEMMVAENLRAKGLGKKLLLHSLEEVDKNSYRDVFIRVWRENKAAVALYKKVGFTPCASIVQPKLLADKKTVFDFEKIYLHQTVK